MHIISCVNLSSSPWGISLRCDLFRKRTDQKNFLLEQQITGLLYLFDDLYNFSLLRITRYFWKIVAEKHFSHSKELFESCEILNVHKLNVLSTGICIHKIKNKIALSSFLEKFEQLSHSYPTRFSSRNCRKPQIKLRKCRFRIFIRGPAIWENLVEVRKNKFNRPLFLRPR